MDPGSCMRRYISVLCLSSPESTTVYGFNWGTAVSSDQCTVRVKPFWGPLAPSSEGGECVSVRKLGTACPGQRHPGQRPGVPMSRHPGQRAQVSPSPHGPHPTPVSLSRHVTPVSVCGV
eukprot:4240573-Prymnesium_polylepis.1